MTPLEIFNRIRDHLLKQNAQSLTNGTCLYHGPNGLTCAVGCLIDQAHYDPVYEGCSVDEVLGEHSEFTPQGVKLGKLKEALEYAGVDTEGQDLLSMLTDLQNVHDHSQPKDWVHALADVRYEYAYLLGEE